MVQAVVTFDRSISLGSYGGLKSEVIEEKLPFWKKRPHTGKFSKIRSERIHRDTDPRAVCKFREIWPTGSR